MRAETRSRPDEQSNLFLHIIVFFLFLAGNILCFPLGFAFGNLAFILGLAAVAAAAVIAIVLSGRDYRVILYQLSLGSLLCAGATVGSTDAILSQGSRYSGTTAFICCPTAFCISLAIFAASLPSRRKKDRLAEGIIFALLVITLCIAFITASYVWSSAVFRSWVGKEPSGSLIVAQIAIFTSITMAATAAFAAIHLDRWGRKRRAVEEGFFVLPKGDRRPGP